MALELHAFGDNGYGEYGDGTIRINALSPSRVVPTRIHLHNRTLQPCYPKVNTINNNNNTKDNSNNIIIIDNNNNNDNYTHNADTTWEHEGDHDPPKQSIVHVAAGAVHTVILTDHGNLYTCGFNHYGQLGLGHRDTRVTSPCMVRALAGEVHAAACGGWHTVVMNDQNQIFSFGSNEHGQLGVSEDVPSFASPQQVLLPFPVAKDSNHARHTTSCTLTAPIQVVCGGWQTYILFDNGSVYTFGKNLQGQLGLGDHINRAFPERISALDPHRVVRIYTGNLANHVFFVTEDGKLYGCGSDHHRQMPVFHGSSGRRHHHDYDACVSTPVPIDLGFIIEENIDVDPHRHLSSSSLYLSNIANMLLKNQIVVTCGSKYTVLASESKIWICGEIPTDVFHDRAELSVAGRVAGVSGGEGHVLLMTDDGAVYAYGHNLDGQCGTGTSDTVLDRVQRVHWHAGEDAAGYTVQCGGWFSILFKGRRRGFDEEGIACSGCNGDVSVLRPYLSTFRRNVSDMFV